VAASTRPGWTGWCPTARSCCGAADTAGTITVGKRADLSLLGADVPSLDDTELASVPVTGTWLAGVQVFG
jgi:predicted amidohydrolase YtcJ